MRTSSDDRNKVFFNSDSANEYQLKLKPTSNKQNESDAQSAATVMDMVAVLKVDETFSVGDIESSATVYICQQTHCDKSEQNL